MSKIGGIYFFEVENPSARKIKSLLRSSTGEVIVLLEVGKSVGLAESNLRSSFAKPQNAARNPSSLQGKFIAADTCLTNRTELARKFGIPDSDLSSCSDKELLLIAYEKWGDDSPQELCGKFAFVIWDEPRKRLFCCRDHFGESTLYFFRDEDKFVIASQPGDVLKIAELECRLNKKKLGIFLHNEPHTHLAEETWFENVFPVPSGSILTVDAAGVKSRRYWSPKPAENLRFKKKEDVIEGFRELLFEVIGNRLPGDQPAGGLLSGGLDSSSIVSVAAKILEKQNRGLDVFSAVLENPADTVYKDEREYIDLFKEFPNVNINYITAPGLGPFSKLEKLFEQYESPQVTSRHYLYRAFSSRAENIGISRLLDGSFGEAGVTDHVIGALSEMFAGLKWKRLVNEIRGRKKVYGESIKYNIRANVLNPLIPSFVVNLRHGRRHSKSPLREIHPFRRDFANDLLKDTRFSGRGPDRIAPNHRTNQLNFLRFIQEKLTDNVGMNLGSPHIDLHFPLLDKRLIEFSMAIPLELKMKGGYKRCLVRESLDGILPRKIQWRTTKLPFSPDYVRRFNSQVGEVKSLLNEISQNDPVREILDVDKIRDMANVEVADGELLTANETIARENLPEAVYLIYFMRRFPEFQL